MRKRSSREGSDVNHTRRLAITYPVPHSHSITQHKVHNTTHTLLLFFFLNSLHSQPLLSWRRFVRGSNRPPFPSRSSSNPPGMPFLSLHQSDASPSSIPLPLISLSGKLCLLLRLPSSPLLHLLPPPPLLLPLPSPNLKHSRYLLCVYALLYFVRLLNFDYVIAD